MQSSGGPIKLSFSPDQNEKTISKNFSASKPQRTSTVYEKMGSQPIKEERSSISISVVDP